MTNPAAWSVMVVFAILDWLAVGLGWVKAKYITKPLVMMVLIAWISLNGGWQYPVLFFTTGAVLSLLGDIWLMLPGNYFLTGLISFLLAHIFYTIGFWIELPVITPIFVLISILVIVCAIVATRKIRRGVYQKAGARRLRWSVTIYSFVITIMFLSALSVTGNPGWELINYLPAAIGGFLFYLSDILLAYDRFVKSIRHGRLFVRITYHVGQIFLLYGAINHFFHI